MKNALDFKKFRRLKKGNSLITEDVINIGDTYRVRGFDVPKSLVNAFKKKAKDSGNDISGKFADTELAEMITKYVQTRFLTIDNLPVELLGDDYSTINIQTNQTQSQTQTQGQTQTQTQGQTQSQSQNTQAQATAQEIPAQEGGQTQTQGQTQGQTQKPAQGQTQKPAQGQTTQEI